MKFLVKILIAVLMLIAVLCVIKTNARQYENYELIEYTVKNGDTLWTISNEFYGNEVNTQEKIFEIKKVNDLPTCQIRTGQVLKLINK